MKKVPIRGAIFDQDGLLFDTEVVFDRSWKAAGREFGVTIPDEMTAACSGCGTDRLPGVIRQFFPELDVAAYIARTFEIVIAAQLSTTPVVKPGVREILEKCRACGVKTAIATSSILKLVEHNLASTGLEGFFDVIVTGKDVKRGKPAPDIFQFAANRLSLPPSDCLVFEDAFTGIRAAAAAGCQPVLVPDRRAPTPEILQLCRCRSSLAETLDLIEGV